MENLKEQEERKLINEQNKIKEGNLKKEVQLKHVNSLKDQLEIIKNKFSEIFDLLDISDCNQIANKIDELESSKLSLLDLKETQKKEIDKIKGEIDELRNKIGNIFYINKHIKYIERYLFSDNHLSNINDSSCLSKSIGNKVISLKEQHLMEEYEKLLNSRNNDKDSKLNQLNKFNKILLKISFTISRIIFQFGNKMSDELSSSSSLSESLKFIALKLEKCLTFLQSENLNNFEEKLSKIKNDQNDSIIISKQDIEPPEWLRLKITKYKSSEDVDKND